MFSALKKYNNRSYRLLKVSTYVISIIIIISIFIYLLHHWGYPSKVHSDWAQFGDYVGGVIGPIVVMYTAIFLVISLCLAVKENINGRLARQENAVISLFQTYISDTFYEKRRHAWMAMTLALYDPEYCKYLVNHFFPIKCDDAPQRKTLNRLKACIDKEDSLDKYNKTEFGKDLYKELKVIDHKIRHCFDDILNFYNILASYIPDEEDSPKEKEMMNAIIKKCDFFYEWYRPFLWWLCDLRMKTYLDIHKEQDGILNPIEYKKSLEKLDRLYFPENTDKYINPIEREKVFRSHPLIIKYVRKVGGQPIYPEYPIYDQNTLKES